MSEYEHKNDVRHDAASIRARKKMKKRKNMVRKWRNILFGILSAVFLIILFIAAFYLNLEINMNLNHAEAVTKVLTIILPVGFAGDAIIYLLQKKSDKQEEQDSPQLYKTVTRFFMIWLAVYVVCAFGMYTKAEFKIAHYKDTQEAEENADAPEESEPEDDKPVRNGTEFVWEEDLFITDLSLYYDYDEESVEIDEDAYALGLILEYLDGIEEAEAISQKTKYNALTAQANEFDRLYIEAVKNNYSLETQKIQKENERGLRIDANTYLEDAENLMLTGNIENTLSGLDKDLNLQSYPEHYEKALFYYIKGLKCAIANIRAGNSKEYNANAAKEIWGYIMEDYAKISEIQLADAQEDLSAQKIADVCQRIDIESYLAD